VRGLRDCDQRTYEFLVGASMNYPIYSICGWRRKYATNTTRCWIARPEAARRRAEAYSVQPVGVVHAGLGCHHVVAAATEYIGGLRLLTYAALSFTQRLHLCRPGCATVATVGLSYEKSISVNSLPYSAGSWLSAPMNWNRPGLTATCVTTVDTFEPR
jgi:hypothetical protein